MATLDEVRSAKIALRFKLNSDPDPRKNPTWLRGIGIGGSLVSPVVCVLVHSMTDEVRAAIPSKMGNVDVIVEAVGDIVAQ